MRFLAAALASGSVALFSAPSLAQTVVLVRHAEKAEAPTDDPALTEAGTARAQALAGLLAHAGVDMILTSPLRRTIDTAAPTATATGVASIPVPIVSRDIAGHVQAVAERVRTVGPGGTALVVGHSNTVPAIIAALGGPQLPGLAECAFDTLFVLSLDGDTPRLVRARYGVPRADCPEG